MARHVLALVLLVSCAVSAGFVFGFAQDAEPARKIVTKVSPQYPALAREMRISGNVRVEALVAPNGKVRLVEIKGGHPVLAQAAADAVNRWKWEPAKNETREPVELKFLPGQ